MTLPESIKDFIEFYLLPWHSAKVIGFIQLKVNKKFSAVTNDELLQTVVAFSQSIAQLKKYRKSPAHTRSSTPHDSSERLYEELHFMSPQDCLILLAKSRYQLNDTTVSLILKISEDSIRFRRKQLLDKLKEEGFSEPDFKSLDPNLIYQSLALRAAPPAKNIFQKFNNFPFAVRFLIETTGVIGTLILLLWIVPEIRNAYENSVQKRINDYLIEASLLDAPAPEGTIKGPKKIELTPTDEEEADKANAPALEEAPLSARKQPKVVEGDTWRFSFTGSLTADLESSLDTLLKKQVSDSVRPLTVPGGIQFDFILPVTKLIDLKVKLEEMTYELQRKSGTSKQNALSSANMSWYKKRNMGTRRIPSGHVQVIIWISTL